jgi:hypothetical protein
VALVGAGVGIKHDDAMIAVTVGNEDFIGRWVDFRIGRPAQAARIGAACLRSGFADLQHELSVLSEFQDVTVVVAIAADPDEAFGIDIDAVLVFEPVVALAWPTPGLEQIAVRIELHHWRGRHAAFGAWRGKRRGLLVVGQRTRPLDDPDIVLRIDGDACGLSDDPVIWQRFRPGCIDLEFGKVVGESGRNRQCADEKRRNDFHGRLPGAGYDPRRHSGNALLSARRNQEVGIILRRSREGSRRCADRDAGRGVRMPLSIRR